MEPEIKRIAIVGGGISGLGAIAALKEVDGFEPVCFEKTESHGGTWFYREQTEVGVPSLMPTTVVNSSKEMSAFSNFPPKNEYKNFMSHQQMYQYITEYAQSKDLLKYMRCNTDVISVKRSEDYESSGKWTVTIQDRITKETTTNVYDGVLICVGHFNRPNMPYYPGQQVFKGKILHTHSLKGVESYRNKTVAVVGMGCSGLDAAVETSKVAKRSMALLKLQNKSQIKIVFVIFLFCMSIVYKKVYLSTRSGAYVSTRTGPCGFPNDYFFYRQCFHYFVKFLPLHILSWLFETLFLKPRLTDNTYKVKPSYNLFAKEPVINDYINEKLSSGEVTQKTGIKDFTEDGIIFQGETEATEVDVVIMATGYKYSFPFLEEDIITQVDGVINLYKCMFPIHLPHSNLAVIGFVLPFGPGIPILELQCRYAVQILAGKCKLPKFEQMLKEVKDKYNSNLSTCAPCEKMSLKVNFMQYSNELASEINAKPNHLKLLIKDTKLFLRVLFGPSLPYQYRLQGPGCWKGARKAILESKLRMSWDIDVSKDNNRSMVWKFIRKIIEFFYL